MRNLKQYEVLILLALTVICIILSGYSMFKINQYDEAINESYIEMNDSFNNRILDLYEDMVSTNKKLELISGEDRSEYINYWQSEIDNYEYVELYRPPSSVNIWARVFGDALPILCLSVFAFYIGKYSFNSSGGNIDE